MNRPPRLPSLPLPKSIRRGLIFLLLALTLGFALILGTTPRATAEVTPQFPCDGTFFFSQGVAGSVGLSTIDTIDTGGGAFIPTTVAGFDTSVDFNALGYNVLDGNLYAVSILPTNNANDSNPYIYRVYRITPTGPVEVRRISVTLNTFGNEGQREAFAGDFDDAGNLVILTGGRDTFRIPISSVNTGTSADAPFNVGTAVSVADGIDVPDIAFNPSDRFLYGLSRSSDSNINTLIRFRPNGTEFQTLSTTVTNTNNNLPYGGAFFGPDGSFYAYRNFTQTGSPPTGDGQFIRISGDLATAATTVTQLSTPPLSLRNDGASCAFAPSFEKSVVPTTANAGDIVTYTYTVRNRTTIALNNITFTDPLENGRTFVGAPTFAGFTGTPNVNFGAGNSSITVTGINLPAAPAPPTTITTATITVQVRIPNNLPTGRIFNQARLQGTIGGTPTQVDTRSDFVGNDTFPDPTPLDVVAQGLIGVAKAASTPIPVVGSPGVFDVPFTIRVQNYGGTRLTNVQVTENLRETFLTAPNAATAAVLQGDPNPPVTIVATGGLGAGGTFQDAPVPATANASNPDFNGSLPADPITGVNELLQAGEVNLQPGDFFDIRYTVRVTPGAVFDYTNQVLATARDPNDALVDDLSQSGNDNNNNPDPDGDGDPRNNDEPTPIRFTIARIGTAKQVGIAVPVAGSPGVFDVPYTILVENFGNTRLTSVQVTENINNTFLTAPPTPPANTAAFQTGSLEIVETDNRDGIPFQGNNTGINNDFNGLPPPAGDTGLLGDNFELQPRDFVVVTFVVRVTPGVSLTYENQVRATGDDPSGNEVFDDSVNNNFDPNNPNAPLNADPDGDGDPTNNQSPTSVTFTPTGIIGVAKAAAAPTPVAGLPGVFDVQFRVRVQNYGSATLTEIQVEEDLNQAFLVAPPTPPANAAAVQGAPAIAATGNIGGGGLQGAFTTGNGDFDGNLGGGNGPNLLAAGNILEPGDFIQITYTIRVTPGTSLNYTNQVEASGLDPGGNRVDDLSTNGDDADPDGDGNPTNNQFPTPVSFSSAVIGVAKQASAPVPVAGNPGLFDITFTVLVENFGTEPLNTVQVTEDLDETFLANPPNTPPANNVAVQELPTVPTTGNRGGTFGGTNPGGNPNFGGNIGGNADTGLLAPGGILQPQDFLIITYTVRVDPGTNLNYNNQVTATGNDPGGNPAPPDLSTNGDNADPDGDGNPNNNQSPTPVSFPTNGLIGVAKAAASPTPVAGLPGVFDVQFTVRVQNFGGIRLTSVQVTENLAPIFITNVNPADAATTQGTPQIITVGRAGGGAFQGSIPGDPLPADGNTAFDGNIPTPTAPPPPPPGRVNLLQAGVEIEPGDFFDIRYTVRVTPGTNLNYTNQVEASGLTPNGTQVTDLSQNGNNNNNNPDPDGDGDPRNNNEPTPISFAVDLQILKRVSNVTGPTYPGGFFNGVEGDGTAVVEAMQAAGVDPVGRQTVNSDDGNRSVQAGDTVQYRIYFVNQGGVEATNVQFCDRIPDGTTYVAGSLQVANPPPAAAANAFIAAGTDVPVPPCVGAVTNPNGAVVTDAVTVNGGAAGFVEFSVTVNP